MRRSRLTLNVTRGAMARMGWCPSGRLFEAAACGVPLVSDNWDGLADFFRPRHRHRHRRAPPNDVIAALDLPDADLARIAASARARVLAHHTAVASRAHALLDLVNLREHA